MNVLKILGIIVFTTVISISLVGCQSECTHCNGTGISCMQKDCKYGCSTWVKTSLNGGPVTYPDCAKCDGEGIIKGMIQIENIKHTIE